MARNYCFTLNNWKIEDEKKLLNKEKCKYCIIGKEIGESGTKHLQGYIEFFSGKRMNTLKKDYGDNIHWEARKGTAQQAADYCKKDGQWKEIGEISKQGRRSDLDAVAEDIKNGTKKKDIASKYPVQYIKFHNGIEKLIELTQYKERTTKPTVTWYWGDTGVGKTRAVFDAYDKDEIYVKDSTKWWNGYTQQKVILIDDFNGEWEIRNLLRLLDRYKYTGETKGGYVNIDSMFIYITCDRSPEEIYIDLRIRKQILRRIDAIHELKFTGPATEVVGNTISTTSENTEGYDNNYKLTTVSDSL